MVRVYYAVAALVLLAACSRGDGASVSREIGDSLIDALDIRTSVPENRTSDFRIPEYMYRLYRDAGNRRTRPPYDSIRSISPETETHGASTVFVYDLSPLRSTENVQKAVLLLEPGDAADGVNVTLFSAAENAVSETYAGSARVDGGSLDLAGVLGPRSVNGLRRLTVRVDGCRNDAATMGLVLYSRNAAAAAGGRAARGSAKGHELAELLFESATLAKRRSRRSVIDNEVDAKKGNHFAAAESKRKRRKKKGPRVSKLRAVDAGDTIAFVDPDQCRMEKLVLNFEEIGWEDWVIYPKGFETNYCAGGCLFPLGKGLRPTNHATVQSLARSFGRLWDVPEPSCVPDTLAPLTLLYMDRSNHVLLKSYPDMRVITCSCK